LWVSKLKEGTGGKLYSGIPAETKKNWEILFTA